MDALVLNSNASLDTFAAYRLPVIPDRLPGFLGPLAGIHAGLMQYQEDCLVTVAVDLPFLPPDLVTRLRAGLGTKSCTYASDTERRPVTEASFTMAEVSGAKPSVNEASFTGQTQEQFFRHALALLWRPGTAASVEDYLQHGGRSLKDFLKLHGRSVRFDRPQDRGLFCNINTPEDLARADQDTPLLE